MARPIKKGLDYYPLDVDFLQDIKIRKIMRACGVQSVAILISLLSSIYRNEGYYVVWDNDMSFLVADEVGASEGAVSEIVSKSIQVEFFNEDIFKKYKVLTSKGIQERFLGAVGRRKNIDLILEYSLLDIDNAYNNLTNVNINLVNVSRSTQSKVKESKVNKSKGNNIELQQDCNDNKFTPTAVLEFNEDSVEVRLSEFMIDEILKVKPDSNVPVKGAKNLQSWAKQIDYMVRLDKRDPKSIAELFRWAQNDSFWCSNIRSPRKLREKWDTLELQKNRDKPHNNHKENNTLSKLEEMYQKALEEEEMN